MALAPACLPRIIKVDSACGCTLTAASIKGLTPLEMENLSNKEIDLARVILGAAEAKALGVQERGLSILLNSSIKNIKGKINQQKVGEQSMILPYIQRPQTSIINANYFALEAGVATPGAGANGIPNSAWNGTITLGSSDWKSPLTNIERYFLPGMTVIVLTWDDTTVKTAKTLQFTIYAAVNANAGGVEKALVTLVPNITDAGYTALSAPNKAALHPTFGVVQTGANSISDRESWCYNQPADLSKKLVLNWLQTTRESRCTDDIYKETLGKIMSGKVNPYMPGFQYLPLAEQNKRAAMLSNDAWLRSVWYNQRINENQTPETYMNLPAVGDVMDPTCVLEYKANALGFFTMLNDCQRVIDLNGNPLDLDFIFGQLYYLKRYRENDGDSIQVIDSLTDRHTANNILDAMTKWYKVKYGVETIRYAKIGEKITNEGQVLFNYNIYDIPEQGVQWAVFHDPFFDDHISAFSNTAGGATDFKSRARNLWFIDWSDISIGIAGTKSVTRKNPDATTLEAYKCVITPNQKEYNLRSTRWTCFLDRPQRHLLIHNFAGTCPTVTAPGCTVPNP
jgi:hypothetical protein